MIRRREFIAGISAAAWPLGLRAQPAERVRRVGVLSAFDANDPPVKLLLTAFTQTLADLGWVAGRNLKIDPRFAGADADRFRDYAAELVNLAPDLIVTNGAVATRTVQQQTHTIPIVFINAGDPLTNGILKSVARPEDNTTGVASKFVSFGSKWLELLKELAPKLERVALVYNAHLIPENNSAILPPIEDAARVLAVQAIRIPYDSGAGIVRGIDAFAAQPRGGLIVLPPPLTAADRETIRRLAIKYRLPTIYTSRQYVTEGGLMSYGTNYVDVARRASSFVDRILRGAKTGDLPVEYPTKFELVINLKTAKTIGLTIPESFLLLADEVIE